jgi:hypothetical protein
MKACALKCFIVVSTILYPTEMIGQSLYKSNNGTIQFYSYAAQEIIKAQSNHLAGIIKVADKTFAFAVNMESFEGFNSSLQREHFNEKYLESEKYPVAKFTGKIIEDVNFSAEGTYDVRAKGVLNIHNVEQERIIKSTITIFKGTIAIKARFNVFLNDHNIRVPKVVHEKIASEIDVYVETILNEAK